MRYLLFVTIILVFGCKQRHSVLQDKTPVDSLKNITAKNIKLPDTNADRLKYHTNHDTVCIYSLSKDTLKYSREDFNDIIDNFPELYSSTVIPPDSAYANSKIWVDLTDSSGNKKHLSFGSEVGQDEFYILYAYFLKNKNGIAKYSVRRKKLLEIYHTLNSLFGQLNYGGTYFGHQYARIEGYAEFSVYWFSHYEDFFDRPYDISKQKGYYISGLKQLIVDEVKIDNNVIDDKEKAERIKMLFNDVANLNKLITDNFYLRMAQSFQSQHY